MKFSMLPILFLIQLVVIYMATKKTQNLDRINSKQRKLVNFLLVAFVIWGGIKFLSQPKRLLPYRKFSKLVTRIMDYSSSSANCHNTLDFFKGFKASH